MHHLNTFFRVLDEEINLTVAGYIDAMVERLEYVLKDKLCHLLFPSAAPQSHPKMLAKKPLRTIE